MKVSKLIEDLKKFDPELEVYVCDEVEGNDCPLSRVEMVKKHMYSEDDVIMIRWS